MIYNKHSLFSLEAIDYQKNDWYIPECNLLNDKIRKGSIDVVEWQRGLAELIKKRFNIRCKINIEENDEVNAAYWNVFLDDTNTHRGYETLAAEYQKALQREARGNAIRIAKGDLSPLGLLDHKKVRVGGLFSKILVNFTFNTGCFKLEPEQLTAITLHELGHAWTYFEYIGVRTFRNAIILNSVNEYLGTKDKEQRTEILIAQSNVWGIQVDAKKVVELSDKNAVQVIIGTYTKTFTEDVGYVQYNNNTSEVIADQFMARFGMGVHYADKNNTLVGDALNEYAKFSNRKFVLAGMKLILDVSIVGLGLTGIGGVAIMGGIVIDAIMNFGFNITIFDLVKEPNKTRAINGFTYDETRDRYKRIYNETMGYLKDNKMPRDIVRQVINDLEYMRSIIDNQKAFKSIPLTIIRWFSADFRSQESKKRYQQMMEELLANELYLTAAKIKQLKD